MEDHLRQADICACPDIANEVAGLDAVGECGLHEALNIGRVLKSLYSDNQV
jgi:hypothetical protein